MSRHLCQPGLLRLGNAHIWRCDSSWSEVGTPGVCVTGLSPRGAGEHAHVLLCRPSPEALPQRELPWRGAASRPVGRMPGVPAGWWLFLSKAPLGQDPGEFPGSEWNCPIPMAAWLRAQPPTPPSLPLRVLPLTMLLLAGVLQTQPAQPVRTGHGSCGGSAEKP